MEGSARLPAAWVVRAGMLFRLSAAPSANMQRETLNTLLRQALRLSATPSDAEDLVQDTLLAGWLAGRTDAPFLHGVLRKQAAMAWRSAGRRAARERDADGPAPVAMPEDACDEAAASDIAAWIAARPRGLRQLAVLALHGLDPMEIRWLLGMAPAAFRQRVAALRAAVMASPSVLRAQLQCLVQRPAAWRQPAMSMPTRRTLKASLAVKPGIATHDPDRHALVIGIRPHVSALRGNEKRSGRAVASKLAPTEICAL